MNFIDYRLVNDIEGFQRVVDLELLVWNLDPRDAVPAYMLRAMTINNSVVIGAYDGETMIGMTFAFPAPRAGEWALWSHMTAVHPDYQSQGVGRGLKQRQYKWAKANGYRQIRWTFDPLQRGNANFNILQLGAHADRYHIDFYGRMNDDINRDMPSDRLEAVWYVTDAAVKPEIPQATPLLQNHDNTPHPCTEIAWGAPLSIAIPRRLQGIAHQTMISWREAVRGAFISAFEYGYEVSGFYETPSEGVYVLTQVG